MGDLAVKLSPAQKNVLQIVEVLMEAGQVDGVYLFGANQRTLKSLHYRELLAYQGNSGALWHITEAGRQALEKS